MEILFDSHAHLDSPNFADLPAVLARAEAAGVRYIVTIGGGDCLGSSERAIAIAQAHENVWAAAGVHPHDAKLMVDEDLPRLMALARSPRVVAIGEIGLDYFKNHSPREVQVKRFRDQLRIARELELPVIIHDRDAHEDTVCILKEDGVGPRGGIIHCFSGPPDLAITLAGMGFYISFTGVITYKNAEPLREVARVVPLEKLLIETDCPFLTPEPFRKKRTENEPAYVRYTAEGLAAARGVSLANIAAATTANAARAYGLNIEVT